MSSKHVGLAEFGPQRVFLQEAHKVCIAVCNPAEFFCTRSVPAWIF